MWFSSWDMGELQLESWKPWAKAQALRRKQAGLEPHTGWRVGEGTFPLIWRKYRGLNRDPPEEWMGLTQPAQLLGGGGL